LSQDLLLFGFKQSNADYTLFTQHNGASFTMVLIYVDDMIIAGNCDEQIVHLKSYLHTQFHIKDLGSCGIS